MKIYLGGAINSCTDSECNNWRQSAIKSLSHKHELINPMDRDYRGEEHIKFREIVEFDKKDIDSSDVLLVNYLKPSVGTSMEILYAWENKKPVILFTKNNQLSPWLIYHTTKIVKTLPDAVLVINK